MSKDRFTYSEGELLVEVDGEFIRVGDIPPEVKARADRAARLDAAARRIDRMKRDHAIDHTIEILDKHRAKKK